jgi:hypothetical protein
MKHPCILSQRFRDPDDLRIGDRILGMFENKQIFNLRGLSKRKDFLNGYPLIHKQSGPHSKRKMSEYEAQVLWK